MSNSRIKFAKSTDPRQGPKGLTTVSDVQLGLVMVHDGLMPSTRGYNP